MFLYFRRIYGFHLSNEICTSLLCSMFVSSEIMQKPKWGVFLGHPVCTQYFSNWIFIQLRTPRERIQAYKWHQGLTNGTWLFTSLHFDKICCWDPTQVSNPDTTADMETFVQRCLCLKVFCPWPMNGWSPSLFSALKLSESYSKSSGWKLLVQSIPAVSCVVLCVIYTGCYILSLHLGAPAIPYKAGSNMAVYLP